MLTIFSTYAQLLKLRIVFMVAATCLMGILLAGGAPLCSRTFLTLFGTALAAGGACALNHYLERELDTLMERTRGRPLPGGAIGAGKALAFGTLLLAAGLVLLAAAINGAAAFLAMLAAGLYLFVYTPVKRISWTCTPIGAIAGAIPPLIGWVSVSHRIELAGWLLFFVLFLWQHVHFYAIAWIYKDDYAHAGFRMLPVVDFTGTSTVRQIVIASAVLLVINQCLGLSMLDATFRWGSLLAGGALLGSSVSFARTPSRTAARLVVIASVSYLPILLALIFWSQQC